MFGDEVVLEPEFAPPNLVLAQVTLPDVVLVVYCVHVNLKHEEFCWLVLLSLMLVITPDVCVCVCVFVCVCVSERERK